ncbi:hypothetical protein Aph01nite_49450 [Acrocarpospora phusangensis]|uniref:Antitoxin n=1 Tax=Acrocarpospora phusangensis TaxID=1070424 RepID=A0A919QHQ2_9ACTN|nr:antitoxin [Acrocarpospora phusangensis]GIH26635.1 hypothetical protein Aph01nite_49450 [Acrocarpospora phusangensis]
MSFFHKVREMFGGAGNKLQSTRAQPKSSGGNAMGTAKDMGRDMGQNARSTTPGAKGQMRQGADGAEDTRSAQGRSNGMRDKIEDKVMDGIDSAAAGADRATGGKYRDQINRTADAARRAADKIDGEPG